MEHKGYGFPDKYVSPQCSEHVAPLKAKYGLFLLWLVGCSPEKQLSPKREPTSCGLIGWHKAKAC